MVERLLPRCSPRSEDSADALAIAICHAHHRAEATRMSSLLTCPMTPNR
jgi:crossover junction endodeoxyribonuclease RuvC